VVTFLSQNRSKTPNDSIEETRLYHERYLRAINSPLRRKILRILKQGPSTFEYLESETGLDMETLNWHLSILEQGLCLKKTEDQGKLVYQITQEGKVVDYME
jgi:DNA-binding transcriptional ArsR family regulator